MSADILSGLVAANIAASAAILLVALIRRPVRKLIGARLAYWLWLIPVLAGVAAILPARDAGTVPAPGAPIQPIAEATVDLATSWAAPVAIPAARSAFDLPAALAITWAIGALVFIAFMLLQQGRTLRALKLAQGNRTANNFGPAVVGVLKPFLVVPADFEQRFSKVEQDLVLAHEAVHLAAGHTRINAVKVALTALNWFNPLVHWAAKLSRDDQELACDATVLERFPRDRGSYAEALLKTQIASQPLPLGCTWPSRSSRFFKERMTMLANKTPSRARRVAGAGFVALAILGAGLTAWAQKPLVPVGAGMVVVDKDGNVTWNGKALADREALKEAAKAQAESGVPSIQLKVDAKAPYMKAEPVIEWAQRSAVKDITFMPTSVVFGAPSPPPPNQPPPPKDLPKPIRVFVDFDGGIYYNGVFVGAVAQDPARYVGASATLAVLDQNFKGDAGMKVPPEIHIEPHIQAPFEAVAAVLAAMKKAGLDKSALVGGGPPDEKGKMILGQIK